MTPAKVSPELAEKWLHDLAATTLSDAMRDYCNAVIAELDRLRDLATQQHDQHARLLKDHADEVGKLTGEVERLTRIVRDLAAENARIPSGNLRLDELIEDAAASLPSEAT